MVGLAVEAESQITKSPVRAMTKEKRTVKDLKRRTLVDGMMLVAETMEVGAAAEAASTASPATDEYEA